MAVTLMTGERNWFDGLLISRVIQEMLIRR